MLIEKIHFSSNRTIKQAWDCDQYTGEELSTVYRWIVCTTNYGSHHAYPVWEVKGQDVDHTINYIMAIVKIAYPSDRVVLRHELPKTKGSDTRMIHDVSKLVCDNIADKIKRASKAPAAE